MSHNVATAADMVAQVQLCLCSEILKTFGNQMIFIAPPPADFLDNTDVIH